MTKLDTPLGYVHCKDIPIRKAIEEYQKEVGQVAFRGLPSCQLSEASFDSGRSTGSSTTSNSSRHSTDLEDGSLGATSEEFYDSIVQQRNINNHAKSEQYELESCDDCRKLNIKDEKENTSETCYLQGARCQKHSDLMRTSAIMNSKTSPNSVSSPTRTPLSNYDRKRTPSGGSVMKQIQSVLISQEEEAKEACRVCDCDWRTWFVMFTLLLANLLNYMDRYTIAGMYGMKTSASEYCLNQRQFKYSTRITPSRMYNHRF